MCSPITSFSSNLNLSGVCNVLRKWIISSLCSFTGTVRADLVITWSNCSPFSISQQDEHNDQRERTAIDENQTDYYDQVVLVHFRELFSRGQESFFRSSHDNRPTHNETGERHETSRRDGKWMKLILLNCLIIALDERTSFLIIRFTGKFFRRHCNGPLYYLDRLIATVFRAPQLGTPPGRAFLLHRVHSHHFHEKVLSDSVFKVFLSPHTSITVFCRTQTRGRWGTELSLSAVNHFRQTFKESVSRLSSFSCLHLATHLPFQLSRRSSIGTEFIVAMVG